MTPGLGLPSALVLGALVALPILAHMTRQRPTDRVAFGAMLLVRRLVKRLRRRRRIKDRLLLAMRALAVLLVAFAAAAPFLSWVGEVPDFEGSGRQVLVVDTSMSMALQDGGGTLLARARAAAADRVTRAPDGVSFGLVAYDATSRPLTLELTDDKARILAQLDTLEPSVHPGDLRAALLDARRLLDGEPGEIVLYSDEAGPTMIPAAEDELARIVEAGSAVVPQPILADPPRNLAVTQASWSDGLEGGQVVFRLMNHGPDAVEVPCEVILPDEQRIAVFVEAPPLGEAEARVTVPREAAGGVGRVHCEDPDLTLDDSRWFHLPQVGASRVMVVDGDPGDTPVRSEVYFLERALAPWGGLKSGVTPEVVGPQGVSQLDADEHSLLFLANVSDPQAIAGEVRDFVRRGGSVVISMGDNVVPDRYNAAFAGLLPAPLRRAEGLADRMEEPVPLALPDTSLELLRPFGRGGRAGFARVGSWRAMTLEPYADGGDVTTLLRYRGGLPALVERRVGKGRVVLWTSTVDRGWSNLPLQAVFMPLVQRLATWLGGGSGGQSQRLDAIVGQRVEVPLDEGLDGLEVRGPSSELVLAREEGSTLVFEPEAPGAYAVRIAGGPPVAWVAVNTDADESDVRRLHSVAAAEARLEPDLFTRRQDLAWPALALALLLLALSALAPPTRATHHEVDDALPEAA